MIFLLRKFEINEFKAGAGGGSSPKYSDWQTKSQTYLFTKTYLELGAPFDLRRKIRDNQADVGLISNQAW